jgi:hypothetical protein
MLSAERVIKPDAIVVAARQLLVVWDEIHRGAQSMARYAQQKLADRSPTLLRQARDFVTVSNQNARSRSSTSTQSPSVSVIQSRAQPSYTRAELGRKVLTREGRITIFAELTDKLAEACGHIWVVAKQAPQTFPYFSPNGLIMLCVNVQFTHVSTPIARDRPSCVYSLATGVGFGPGFYSKPDRPRSRVPEKCRR